MSPIGEFGHCVGTLTGGTEGSRRFLGGERTVYGSLCAPGTAPDEMRSGRFL